MTRSLHVALLQLRAYDLADHRQAWTALLRRIDEAAALQPHPDLLVLPEASYPAYFLHSRTAYEAAGVLQDGEVEEALAERARRHGLAIAAGVVQHGGPVTATNDRLENVALLFGEDGTLLARSAKRFLWHFDTRWFAPGDRFPVVEVAGARAGLFVCADARLPEVPRTLAVGGAELLIDCTAWVSSGRSAAALSTPQVEYLLPARAIENGVWIVAAGKVGVEAGSIVYAGRSGVVDPDGQWVAQAPSDAAGVVTCTIDLDRAAGAPITRRPELYADAALPAERARATQLARAPIAVQTSAARVAALALAPSPSAIELMERVRTQVRTLAAQAVSLVVLPDLAGADARAVSQRELLPLLIALSGEAEVMLTVVLAERELQRTYKTAYVINRGEVVALHRQSHLSEREREVGFAEGSVAPPVLETAVGHLGLLLGVEGLVPELARGLKLRGAELVAWNAGDVRAPLRTLARARANENRAYFVAAGDTSELGGACVVDPTGAVLMDTLSGVAMAASADTNRALARWHEMAPGTDPIRDRRPEIFGALFAHAEVAAAR